MEEVIVRTGRQKAGFARWNRVLAGRAQADGRPIVFYQVAASNGCGIAVP